MARTKTKKTKDPARIQRARLILRGIKRLLGEVTRKHYRIGTQLNKLDDLGLYVDLGYATMDELIRGEGLPSPRSMRKLMVVARSYDEATFDALGLSAAYQLFLYTVATPEPDLAQKLAESDAVIAGKKVSEHTSVSLKEARESTPTPKRPESTADRTARALHRALEARGAHPVHVLYRNLAGRWVVDIRLELDDALLLAK